MAAVDVLTDRLGVSLGHAAPPFRPHTPRVLDHRMYPDIMDAIMADISPRGSLVLRATSREFRDRVDNELWRHIALGPSDTGVGISVAAAGGSMPLRIRHCGHTTHADDCGADRAAPNEIFPALLDRARVVSIRGPVDAYGGSLAWFSPKLTHIEILRLLPPMPRPFTIWPDTVRGVQTVVVFTIMTRGSRHYIHDSSNDAPGEIYKPPFTPVPPLPSSASRLVLNITYHPDDPFLPDARLAPALLSPKLTEVVIIFTGAEPPDVPPNLGTLRRPIRRPALGILHPTIMSMLGNSRAKVTIVDVLQLGNLALGLEADFEGDHKEALLEVAAEIFLTQGVGFDQKDPTKNLKIVSLDEYRVSVCEEDFILETEQ